MPLEASVLGLPGFVIESAEGTDPVVMKVRYIGPVNCPECQGSSLRVKDRRVRAVRHAGFGVRSCWLILEARKYLCKGCGRYFNQRFPGIGLWRRSTEPFRRQIYTQHHGGISQHTLAQQEHLGSATVERWYQELLDLKARERIDASCPRVLGIDEHFFSKKDGFATTFCDLAKHRIFDVVLGRSEKTLESYMNGLIGKDQVRVVCMDLSTTYRSIAQKHFPKALIVADRFHVIRLVNQHFLAAWSLIDPKGRANRGLLSLVRRHAERLRPDQRHRLMVYLEDHPAFKVIYQFKQLLCRLLRFKHRTSRQCRRLIPHLLRAISSLKSSGFSPLVQLGETLDAWKDEIARMWRFTKNNGITEGFHNKMEMISRRAFGFRNFENYRLRVKVLCG